MNWLRSQRGSIMVETAITLPLVLLLTVGGTSVLWWLHNKAMMHLVVSETARERAGDGKWLGYVKDGVLAMMGPAETFGLPDLHAYSFHLTTDPPLVMVVACSSPAGIVPKPVTFSAPQSSKAPARPPDDEGLLFGLGPVLGVSRELRNYAQEALDRVNEVEREVDAWATPGVATAEQVLWYQRATANLLMGEEFHRRQTVDYLVGGLLEMAAQEPCRTDANGGVILTAKAVIQGEPVYAQR